VSVWLEASGDMSLGKVQREDQEPRGDSHRVGDVEEQAVGVMLRGDVEKQGAGGPMPKLA
jgi:hypothetical protein